MAESNLFDPKKIDVLDTKKRKIWQNPEEILGVIEIRSSFVAADIGCGSGFFTLPLSEKVAKVFAVDVQMEMLEYLERKIRISKIEKIQSLLAQKNEIPLENKCVDLLLSVNTLHEFDDKDRVISEMGRVLKQGGKALISDWKNENTVFGPPNAIRVSTKQTVNLFKQKGFNLLRKKNLLYHYLLVFEKK